MEKLRRRKVGEIKSGKCAHLIVKFYWLTNLQIKFSRRFRNVNNRNKRHIFISIDGTHCPIFELCLFSPHYFSHKMSYEIGLSLRSSDIVWVNGGFLAGKYNDIKIAYYRLFNWLEDGEKVVADDGYCGSQKVIYPKSGRSDNRLLRKILARHEIND